jgi:hypothetical protein
MKSIRTAFVALIAIFAISAVAASSALASPEWYVKKAGKFEKVKEALNVTGTASWELTDKVGPILKRFGMACTSTDEAQLKPGGIGLITQIQELHCVPVNGCEKLSGEVKPVNLPWKLELYKEGGEVRAKIGSESGTPTQTFTCRQNLTEKTDECGVNTNTKMTNISLTGFAEATFDEKSAKTHCTWSGANNGEWTGTLVTVKPKAGTGVEAIKVE